MIVFIYKWLKMPFFADMEATKIDAASSPEPQPQPQPANEVELVAKHTADNDEAGPEEATDAAASADADHAATDAAKASNEATSADVEPAKGQEQDAKEEEAQAAKEEQDDQSEEVAAPLVEVEVGDDKVLVAPKEGATEAGGADAAEDAPAGRGPEEAPDPAGVLDESTLLDEAQRLMSERSGEL
jgi:hypothetical protein